MKKWIITISIIITAVTAGILSIRYKTSNRDITADTTRVGLIVVGTCEDGSYSKSHYDALNRIKEELNLEIILRDEVPEDSICYDKIVGLIKNDGCKIIITTSYGYGSYVEKAAETYPEVCFFNIAGNGSADNLSSYTGRMYQIRYLAGIAAGLRTVSGNIGYVASYPRAETIRDINAFTLGVKSVNSEANVYVKYCYSAVDEKAAANAASDLINIDNADIITSNTNTLSPYEEADKRKICSIGYGTDMSDIFPETNIVSCVWNWENYYREEILSVLRGKFSGGHGFIEEEYEPCVLSELTKNAAVRTDVTVNYSKARFNNRSFDVFYGPISDTYGNIRVEEGESMPDEIILDRFEWYVKGVYVED